LHREALNIVIRFFKLFLFLSFDPSASRKALNDTPTHYIPHEAGFAVYKGCGAEKQDFEVIKSGCLH